MQTALVDAYEQGKLKGRALLHVRRLVERRRAHGRKLGRVNGSKSRRTNAESLVRTYEMEVEKQRVFLKKAKLCETKLVFVVSALRELFRDEHFVTLLRAEDLQTVPRGLMSKISPSDAED